MNVGRNYNGPKVEIAALAKSGCMLETLSIPRYDDAKAPRENAMGADNQQERLKLRLENPQRLHAGHSNVTSEDIVPTAWRHAGMVRQLQIGNSQFSILNAQLGHPLKQLSKIISEIPCRVSSDLHESCND